MASTATGSGPSSLACLFCRTKHLKCDGQMPTCGRCLEHGLDCTYVKSRRGYQGRKKKRSFPDFASDLTSTNFVTNAPDSSDINTSFGDLGDLDSSSIDPTLALTDFPMAIDQQTQSEETISLPHVNSQDYANHESYERLIRVFYRDVHPAHPIVLPQKMYLQNRNVLPEYLKTVMAFMASHLTSEHSDQLRDKAEGIFDPTVPDDAFKVQGLLLLTLTSYARFERDRGNRALTQATTLAAQLGMDSNFFGQGQGAAYRESWRRTYWELYTITGLISLIAGENFRIRRPEDLLLPGHCEDYREGRTSQSRDLSSMRNRVSAEDNFRWSSFAYKIEAMRIMSSVFEGENSHGSLTEVQVQALGASITGFLLSLPDDKRTPLTDDGEIDEVMSCALMVINLAGVCLHFPRSSLAGKASFKTVCGNDRKEKMESPDERFHRAAAIRYANGLSKLISSRHSLRTLTPCFSCSIAFAAAVHLAAVLPRDSSEQQHKEHIQLELSALNVVGAIWPIGGVVKAQLASYSREVLWRSAQQSFPAVTEAQPPEPLPLANEPWLDELTSQYLDVPPEGFLFNLLDQSGANSSETR